MKSKDRLQMCGGRERCQPIYEVLVAHDLLGLWGGGGEAHNTKQLPRNELSWGGGAYNTCCSQVVMHPSGDLTRTGVFSVVERWG